MSVWLADSARPDLIAHVQAKTGIQIIPTNKETIPTGITRVASLLSTGRWHFTSRCQVAIDEHMKYHYPMKNGKPHGELPVDKDNHTCDCSRYLVDYLAQIGYMGDYIQSEWTPPLTKEYAAPDMGVYDGPY